MSINIDPAFENVGDKPGLLSWRIENKQVDPVPKDNVASLYSGDSYIFLKTIQTSSALKHNIHFWLGKETSQDESGIAAYKTVELDEALGGSPVQYRECQNHESALFLSYFKKNGLQYLEGGVASGFKHVERDQYQTRLLHVKGKRTVRVSEVKCSNDSLNDGDVFILDKGLTLFLFNGSHANRMEKAKGADMIRQIRDTERSGRASIILLEDDPKNEEFWSTLGGYVEVSSSANYDEDDHSADKSYQQSLELFRLSDSEGSLQFEKVTPSDHKLSRSAMSDSDVYIVDGQTEVYIWIGKDASKDERRNGMKYAMDYLSQNGRSSNTRITRVIQDGETPIFKSLFYQWAPPKPFVFGYQPIDVSSGHSNDEVDLSALTLKEKRENSEEDLLRNVVDQKLEIWRIEDMEKVPLEKELYGQFYGGDSYILLFSYKKTVQAKEEYILYFWQGRQSSTDEKGASALLTIDLDNHRLSGKAIQVRVIQGKEPVHFRSLFEGKMVIHSGGTASGFKNQNDTDSYDVDGVYFYHVKGTDPVNICASQIEEKSKNLNSGDCFILNISKGEEGKNVVYIWCGNQSSDDEKRIAQQIGENIFNKSNKKEVVVLTEGNEPEEFWGYLGGKAEYPSVKQRCDLLPNEPRLFQCSNVTGHFKIEEIVDFSQDDLNVDDVFLLDTYSSIYLWIGTNANTQEIQKSNEVAKDYIEAVQDGRGDGIPVVTLKAGNEPSMFTCNFLAWDDGLFESQIFLDPYEERLRKLREEKEKEKQQDLPGTITMDEVSAKASESVRKESTPASGTASDYYSYEDLVNNAIPGIDPARKEQYLSPEEFQKVMGVSKDEFEKLPKWRQQAMKKEKSIF